MTTAVERSRVLVVDDEPQITRVLRTVLTSQGYQVQTAGEGEAALTSFSEWRPELVITDLYMPHMDGLELCRRIRAVSAVPIIVLSVKGEERTKVEALDSGAGLGLSIARRLVEAQGGQIWIDDGDGHGTVVVVTLPAVAESVEAPAPAAAMSAQ